MARYNEILVGRLNRFLQKYLSMKGDAPAPQLATEWTPTINFDAGVELRYLEGWNRYMLLTQVTAAAANTSGFRIRNDPRANIIAVIEAFWVSETVTDNFVLGHGISGGVDLASVISVPTFTRIDPRGNQTPACILSSQNTTPTLTIPGGIVGAVHVLANTPWNWITGPDTELVLGPGDHYQSQAGTVNVEHDVTLIWRERFLEESERT